MSELTEETGAPPQNQSWEREKFDQECRLQREHLEIERERLRSEQRRAKLLGIFVPVSLTLIGIMPVIATAYFEYRRQEEQVTNTLAQQRAQFEASLIIQAISSTEESTLTNMNFLIDTRLIGDDIADRLSTYFEALETNADDP